MPNAPTPQRSVLPAVLLALAVALAVTLATALLAVAPAPLLVLILLGGTITASAIDMAKFFGV
jgi:hypothetical protein